MKKIIKILLLLVLLLLLLEIFLYYKNKGNIILYISNESNIENANLEIYVDNIQIKKDTLTNGFHIYDKYPIKLDIGHHEIMIRINNNEEIIKTNIFLVTWIIIDFYEDDLLSDPNEKKFTNNIFYTPFFKIM